MVTKVLAFLFINLYCPRLSDSRNQISSPSLQISLRFLTREMTANFFNHLLWVFIVEESDQELNEMNRNLFRFSNAITTSLFDTLRLVHLSTWVWIWSALLPTCQDAYRNIQRYTYWIKDSISRPFMQCTWCLEMFGISLQVLWFWRRSSSSTYYIFGSPNLYNKPKTHTYTKWQITKSQKTQAASPTKPHKPSPKHS